MSPTLDGICTVSQNVPSGLTVSIFPEKLKLAKVIPLYKKDDKLMMGNYRPISLLTSISKLFEKVAFEQLSDYFSSNNYFPDGQYGFREKHSTELAVGMATFDHWWRCRLSIYHDQCMCLCVWLYCAVIFANVIYVYLSNKRFLILIYENSRSYVRWSLARENQIHLPVLCQFQLSLFWVYHIPATSFVWNVITFFGEILRENVMTANQSITFLISLTYKIKRSGPKWIPEKQQFIFDISDLPCFHTDIYLWDSHWTNEAHCFNTIVFKLV